MPTTASIPGCDRHHRHVGVCAVCQRAQLARWRAQLLDAEAARHRARSGGPRGPEMLSVRLASEAGAG